MEEKDQKTHRMSTRVRNTKKRFNPSDHTLIEESPKKKDQEPNFLDLPELNLPLLEIKPPKPVKPSVQEDSNNGTCFKLNLENPTN